MTLLELPQPYDFELSTGRYRAFGPDLANLWHEGALYRAVNGREVRITAAAGGVEVESLDDASRGEVEWLLGVPFDLESFREFASSVPLLAPMVEALAGLRPPLAPDPFETLVSAITAQQVSLRAAFAIRNRFILEFGEAASRAHSFPRRERVAAADPEALTRLGFSRRKAESLLGVARSELDFAELAMLPDDEIKGRLVELKGIGEWTADWYLARHLARPEAWPAGDLGLRKAVRLYYGEVDDLRAFGERFSPYQNLSAHYLLTAMLTGWTP